jgi:hypothetical protein
MADVRPVRLQLSRREGFDLQALSLAANGLPAVNCARPSKFGNPFTMAAAIDSEYANKETARPFVVECFRDWLGPSQRGRDWWQGDESDRHRTAILSGLGNLRGKNLACWCALPNAGDPDICHAAVLLDLANRQTCEGI